MPKSVAPALRALASRIIDYAGTFPPAALPCGAAAENFANYRKREHAWMLRWLVVSAADLERIPTEFDGSLSVLAEADVPRAAAIEARRALHAGRPVYCEVPVA